jgi:hypothetical protein
VGLSTVHKKSTAVFRCKAKVKIFLLSLSHQLLYTCMKH